VARSALTAKERIRFARQLKNLPGFSTRCQQALKEARVLVVGLGGVGSPCALYLASAGVGTLGLADPDKVELSNLQRQILHGTPELGNPKTDSARRALKRLNPATKLQLYPQGLEPKSARAIVKRFDLVADCSDNFSTRFLANDTAFLEGKALAHAGVAAYQCQLFLTDPAEQKSPCLRCVMPEVPRPGKKQAGILPPVCGIAGSLLALMIIKHLCALGERQTGKLFHFDAEKMAFRALKIARDCHCPLCGSSPTITQLCARNYPKK